MSNLINRLRTKPPTYEDAVEAAFEIEQLREALMCVVLYWDEWRDAFDGHPTALSLEEVVNIVRSTLRESEK